MDMKKYEFQYTKPEDKECEKHAKEDEYWDIHWKHKGKQCPYCILLDRLKNDEILKNVYEEQFGCTEQDFNRFRFEFSTRAKEIR